MFPADTNNAKQKGPSPLLCPLFEPCTHFSRVPCLEFLLWCSCQALPSGLLTNSAGILLSSSESGWGPLALECCTLLVYLFLVCPALVPSPVEWFLLCNPTPVFAFRSLPRRAHSASWLHIWSPPLCISSPGCFQELQLAYVVTRLLGVLTGISSVTSKTRPLIPQLGRIFLLCLLCSTPGYPPAQALFPSLSTCFFQ